MTVVSPEMNTIRNKMHDDIVCLNEKIFLSIQKIINIFKLVCCDLVLS